MIQIYQAKPRDAQTVATLEAECFSDAVSAETLCSYLSSEIYVYFLAVSENGDPLGYIGTTVCAGEAEILNIAVLPAYRRQGIARGLMENFLAEAKARKAEKIFLEVRESNTPARELYTSFGFSVIGVRKKYYSSPVENAILMAKEMW